MLPFPANQTPTARYARYNVAISRQPNSYCPLRPLQCCPFPPTKLLLHATPVTMLPFPANQTPTARYTHDNGVLCTGSFIIAGISLPPSTSM